jgi:PEGA domain
MAVIKTSSTAIRTQLRLHSLACCVFLLVATIAIAKTYNEGLKLYQGGNFAGAEKALVAAATKGGAPNEKARIFKLLGIVQFSRQNKNGAKTSFLAALRLDKNVKIEKSEVLDESIIGFFESVRKTSERNSGKKPTKNVASAGSQKGRPGIIATSPSALSKPAPKQTLITVDSNVRATVIMDGILAGTSGTTINADPGPHDLRIEADGYETAKTKVVAVEDRDTTVQVNLVKKTPPPAPTPLPVARPKATGSTAQSPAPKSPLAGGKKPSGGKKAASPSLFGNSGRNSPQAPIGRDLATEFALDSQYPATHAPQAPIYQAPAYQTPQPSYAPQPVPQYAPQPYAPAYPQPMVPGYGQPPIYPQQPVYQQPAPVYVQPPVYQQPAPVYTAPPPPPLPPPTYVQAAPDPAPINPGADYLPGPSKKGGKKKTPSKPKGSMLIALLPLGAGQFQNGQHLLGTLFAAAQAGGIGFYLYSEQQAEEAAASANKKLAELNEEEQSISDQQARDDHRANMDAYAEQTSKYVAGLHQNAEFGLYGGIGAYALSVTLALITMGDTSEKSVSAVTTDDGDDQLAASPSSQISAGISLLPAPNSKAPVVNLNLAWKF